MGAGHATPAARLVAAAAVLVLLGACGGASSQSAAEGGTTDPSAIASRSTGPSPGDLPTEMPSARRSGSHRGGGNGGGDGGYRGSDEEPAIEPAIEVAGPTLEDDYPEFFGNIYPDSTTKCANITSGTSAYPVHVDAVAVQAPLVLTPSCRPESGGPAGPPCRSGVVLRPERGNACTVGVTFRSGTDLTQNYELTMTWQLSTTCTDTAELPCSAPEVAQHGPSTEAPALVAWARTTALRYCGATDYADDQGNPGGRGYPPDSGCSAEPPPATTDGPGTPEGSDPGSPSTAASETPGSATPSASPDGSTTPTSDG